MVTLPQLRIGETEQERELLGPQISPIEHVTATLPPIRLFHGAAAAAPALAPFLVG